MKTFFACFGLLVLFCHHLSAAPASPTALAKTPPALFADEPWMPSHSASFTGVTKNSITLNWFGGDGFGRIVIARKGSPVDILPADGINYWANSNFGDGIDYGFDGQYVVYNGNGSEVTITNLEPSTTYYFAVFEYNVDFEPFETNHNYLDWIFLTASQTTKPEPLPLTWLQFDYAKTNKGIELKWSTANEQNTASFEIERSRDGLHFHQIATLTTNDLITTNHYSYTDAIVRGSAYYRIKQVDVDGKFTFSKIIAVQAPQPQTLKIYPNPAQNQLFVLVKEKALVSVFNPAGKHMLTSVLSSTSAINVQSLPPGMYFIEIVEGAQYYRLQFFKK